MQHDATAPAGHTGSRIPWLLATALCLSGCVAHAPPTAQPRTHVGYRAVENASTEHYAVAPDENVNTPVAIDNPPPAYPPEEVARRMPHVSVRAKIIVDTEGRVADIRFAAAGDDGHAPAFDAAVRAAVSRWRFVPLRIEQWRDVTDAQGNVVDAERIRDEVKPFSLDYEFSFDLRDGKPVVATSRGGAR